MNFIKVKMNVMGDMFYNKKRKKKKKSALYTFLSGI